MSFLYVCIEALKDCVNTLVSTAYFSTTCSYNQCVTWPRIRLFPLVATKNFLKHIFHLRQNLNPILYIFFRLKWKQAEIFFRCLNTHRKVYTNVISNKCILNIQHFHTITVRYLRCKLLVFGYLGVGWNFLVVKK